MAWRIAEGQLGEERSAEGILEAFFRRLRDSGRGVLVSDYDGTLAPFQRERDQAVPFLGVPELLESIQASGNRVVLVTGRPAGNLARLLNLAQPPEIWGAHGLERLHRDGRLEKCPLSAVVVERLQAALSYAQAAGWDDFLEVKYGCLALHWRALDEERRKQVQEAAPGVWGIFAGEGIGLHEFDGGLELRASVCDKGTAVTRVLDEEEPNAVAAYLGDDRTDEDAFAAIAGRGLACLVRPQFRPTRAEVWLKPPDELRSFLRKWWNCTGK